MDNVSCDSLDEIYQDIRKALEEKLTAEDYGIAIGKDNADLQQKINDALKKLKENGEYDKIFAKWFGEKK